MGSKELSAVDHGQFEMPLARQPQQQMIDVSLIYRQPTFMAAINLCISASGLEDKELYIPLEVDAGHWTRIRRGEAHFPTNKITRLMDLCGNKAPAIWLAYQMGDELKPLRSSLERQLEDERAARMEAERKLETILEYEKAKSR